jgi:hypothetical protein
MLEDSSQVPEYHWHIHKFVLVRSFITWAKRYKSPSVTAEIQGRSFIIFRPQSCNLRHHGARNFHLSGPFKKQLAGKKFVSLTWSKLSPPAYKHLTPVCYTPGHKHVAMMELLLKCQWRLHDSLVCIICYPCTMSTSFTHSEIAQLARKMQILSISATHFDLLLAIIR